jgi:hypothetical protein
MLLRHRSHGGPLAADPWEELRDECRRPRSTRWTGGLAGADPRGWQALAALAAMQFMLIMVVAIVIGLDRLAGRTVHVIANSPLRKAG